MRHTTQATATPWQTSAHVHSIRATSIPRQVAALSCPSDAADVFPDTICYVRLGRLAVFLALTAFWATVIVTFL